MKYLKQIVGKLIEILLLLFAKNKVWLDVNEI